MKNCSWIVSKPIPYKGKPRFFEIDERYRQYYLDQEEKEVTMKYGFRFSKYVIGLFIPLFLFEWYRGQGHGMFYIRTLKGFRGFRKLERIAAIKRRKG